MFHPSSLFAVVSLVWISVIQGTKSDKVLQFPNLYPENGASQPKTGMMYFSSVYKASVVKYDPIKDTFKEIQVPSITNQPGTHISGIEADRSSSKIWAVVDAAAAFQTNGADLYGPSALVSISSDDRVVKLIDLLPALAQARRINGGYQVGGTQDATTDHQGNVYIVASFGQAIIKVDGKTMQPSVFFAQKNPKPSTMTYSGIELADAHTLMVWNNQYSRIETFDLGSSTPQPSIPSAKTPSQPIMGDAIFIPSFSNGACVLISNDASNCIEVFTTKDGWKSTTHSASIKADKFGGTPTFTYEMNSRIYYGVIYFTDKEPQSRRTFPQGDITDSVMSACRK